MDTGLLEQVFLKVYKVKEEGGKVTLQSSLFDGTVFTFVVANHEYEAQEGDVCSFVKVARTGKGTVFSEVVLPKPALNYGHIVRVSQNDVLTHEDYFKLMQLKKQAVSPA